MNSLNFLKTLTIGLNRSELLSIIDDFFQQNIILNFDDKLLNYIFKNNYDYIFKYMLENGYLYSLLITINFNKIKNEIDPSQEESLVYACHFPYFIIKSIFPSLNPLQCSFDRKHYDTIKYISNFYKDIKEYNPENNDVSDLHNKHFYYFIYLFFNNRQFYENNTTYLFDLLKIKNKIFFFNYIKYDFNDHLITLLYENNSLHQIKKFSPQYLKNKFYLDYFLKYNSNHIIKEYFIFEKLYIEDIEFDIYKQVIDNLFDSTMKDFYIDDYINSFNSLLKSFDYQKYSEYYHLILLKFIDNFKKHSNLELLFQIMINKYIVNNDFYLLFVSLINDNFDLRPYYKGFPKQLIEAIELNININNF